MSRKLIVLVFFSLVSMPASLSAQSKDVRWLIDTTVTIMRKNSVNSRSVNWTVLKKNALLKAKGINDPYKLGEVMRYLYRSLGDYHGAFFYRDSTFRWQRDERKPTAEMMNEWKKGVESLTRLLGNDIGYLRMPPMMVATQEDFVVKAQRLNDSLCVLLRQGVRGIILDLRLNGGGAMHPMISGLQQLLGDGKVGEFHQEKKEIWYVMHNAFYVDTTAYSKIEPVCDRDGADMPVVVITGGFTGSSGEFLAMAFKGRKNTVLLGERTQGWVTVNNGFDITETSAMNLAVGYGADRNGKIYREAISPDIYVKGDDAFNDIANDIKVKAAVKWLKNRLAPRK